MGLLRERRDHPGRYPDAESVGVELRGRHMLEVAAGLVVREEVGRTVPRRRLAQRGDELLLDAHPNRDVRGRVLVPAPGEARDDERHLRQPPEFQVIEVAAPAAAGALIVRPPLPEDEDVVGVAERDAVHPDVVDPPREVGVLEQVEDDRVVEGAVAPHAVGRDPAGRPRRGVEAVRPGRPEQRAEVVPAQRRVGEQAVVERKLGGGVVAHRPDAVRRVEAVHRSGVPLLVDGVPPVADVGGR